jgi:steroid 5-alpha reductase family enzyme
MAPAMGALTGPAATLAAAAVADVAAQLAGWAVSVALRTEKLYDGIGSLTFLGLAVGSLIFGGSYGPRQVCVTACVALWALRLGGLLVYRVFKTGGDSRSEGGGRGWPRLSVSDALSTLAPPHPAPRHPRFDEALKKPLLYLVFWLMQALWVFLTLSSTLWLNGSPPGPGFRWTDAVGGGLFLAGFSIEAVADAQKLKWRLNPANKGCFIQTGLWSLARYPNYFGEMTLWWGVWLLAVPSFGRSGAWATILGPCFVALLLLKVSGIPLQEAQAASRWGGEAGYRAHVARTRLLVPLPRFGGGGGVGAAPAAG